LTRFERRIAETAAISSSVKLGQGGREESVIAGER
jgi:hypothetical protein